jgi:competence protein ComGD
VLVKRKRLLNKKFKKQAGYLMIEMMIVLLIMGIIGSVAYPKFDSFMKNRKTEYFLSSLQKDIIHIQQKAINESRVYSITFNNDEHIYKIRANGSNNHINRSIPKHIIVEGHSMTLSIQFNQYGNISRAGTLYIYSEKQSYKMVFQIGKGKFYVTKQ